MSTMDDTDTAVTSVVLACALSPPFAVLLVALRFYTARSILRTIRWDDLFILLALIFSIGYSITLIFLTQHGLGYHMSYIRRMGWGFKNFMLISGFPASITGCLATLFTKVSVLYFYLRFSTSRRFNAAIYIVLFVVVVSNLLGAFGIVFYCQPMWYFWEALDNPGLTGTCIRADPWYAWLLIINIITDGVLLVLPAWIIYPLRVGFAQKVAIGAILGTGGFILAVSILRFIIVSNGWGNNDLTHKFATNYVWSVIETNVAIVCACLPCLRALVGRYIPSLLHLAGRREPMDIYTIPISHVAQRPPERPVASDGQNKNSNPSTCGNSSWMSSEPLNPDRSSGIREDDTA